MFLEIILLILGFVILIKGADILVEGSSSVAKKLNISDIVIGLTIVAFGTSLPELIVSLYASYKGNTSIAIGNVIGSNIANILLILGAAALIYPIKVKSNTIYKEIPFNIFTVLVLGILVNDILLDSSLNSVISRIDGLILLCFFSLYMFYVYQISKNEKSEDDGVELLSNFKSGLFIFFGMLGLFFGGKLLVDNAVIIAKFLNMSDSLIGLTIIAIGTSFPELVTSMVAAFKKKSDIAIGNVIGSNIFNVYWILGLSSTINFLQFDLQSIADLIILFFISVLLFIFMFTDKKHEISKLEGGIFVFLYLVYTIYLIFFRI